MPAVDVAARLSAAPPRNGRFYTVAVDGRGGSGKTTLAERLRELLPGFDVLNGDDYFEPVDSHVVWGEFNEERFLAEVITPLADGDTFTHRRYSWDAGALEPPVPTRVVAGVIVERCFSFDLPLDWDLRIWVEAPADVCLARGLARDLLPADQVLRAWREAWQPREDDYIASRRPEATADVVVDGVRPFGPQLADGILDAVDGTETP